MFTEAPQSGARLPAVHITLPDGSLVSSKQSNVNQVLSHALGREVSLGATERLHAQAGKAEEYWPDIEGLDYRDTVTEFDLPDGTFFDCAVVHVLTTATINRLRELYPQGRFETRRFRPNVVIEASADAKGFVEND